MKKSLSFICTFGILTLCGCGSKMAPVEGVVLLDGKPLAGATVSLTPVGPGQIASALSDNDGRFQAGTYKTDDGVFPGKYKVTVTKTVMVAKPPEFQDPANRQAGPTDPIVMARMAETLRQEQRKADSVPKIYGTEQSPLVVDVPPEGNRDVRLDLDSTKKE